MKKWRLFSFVLISMVFSGCSNQEYFMLSNGTNETISVKYQLEKPKEMNALFTIPAEIYQANQHLLPEWEHKLPYKDLNIGDDYIHINLPPKSVLVFGTLHNDKYDSKTKKTSGGKGFNLVQMTFETNGIEVLVNEDNFQDYFLEDAGMFRYVIR